jgi:hypothetical protein
MWAYGLDRAGQDRALVNAVINLRVQLNEGNVLTS